MIAQTPLENLKVSLAQWFTENRDVMFCLFICSAQCRGKGFSNTNSLYPILKKEAAEQLWTWNYT